MRCDSLPMPLENLLDKLARIACYAPFKCRACRAKFYRKSQPIPSNPPAVPATLPQIAPVKKLAARRNDPAETRRRLENIIRLAEVSRPRRD